LHQKWSNERGVQSIKVGYEIYGQQNDTEVLRDYMGREAYAFTLHELNTPRQGRHSKSDRIERLEPDLRESRFFLPGVVHHAEFGVRDAKADVPVGAALWDVWGEADAVRESAPHPVGQIVYRPMRDLPRVQRALAAAGEGHRVVRAIKRRDEDNA